MLSRVIVASTGLAALVHATAWACTCAPRTWTPEELVDEHALLVFGEVLSVRTHAGCGGVSSLEPMDVRVEVHEAWVGADAGDVVTVRTARSSASCGVPFEVGDTWLVASSDGETVSLCGASRPLAEDDPLLDQL